MTNQKRYSNIDLLEFFGIFFVVFYHSTTYEYDWVETPKKIFYLRYFMRTILSTCVPLFFFANGYLLLNKKFDLKKHIFKSLKLIALTFIWGLIGIITIMPLEGEHFTIREIFSNLWNWLPIGWINHVWYMGALICIYVFFPLIKNVYDTNRKIFIYFTTVVTILTLGNTMLCNIVSVFANIFLHKNDITSINFFNMFNPFRELYGYAFAYFCIGGLAFEYKAKIEQISNKKRNAIAIFTILICCTFSSCLWGFYSISKEHIWDVVWSGYDTIFTAITLIALFILSLSYNKNNFIIKTISNNTMGIFFIHYIVIHLTRKYVVLVPLFCTYIGNCFYALGIVAICIGIIFVLKKIPILKWIV